MTEFPKELMRDRVCNEGAGQAMDSTAAVRPQPKPDYSRMTKQRLITELETVLLRLTASEQEHIKQYELTIRSQIEAKNLHEKLWNYRQVIKNQSESIACMARS